MRFYDKSWRGAKRATAVARDGPEVWEAGAAVEYWDGSAYRAGTVEERAVEGARSVRVAGADRPVAQVLLQDEPYFWAGPVQRRFLARATVAFIEGLMR